jgi:hypothetical protein
MRRTPCDSRAVPFSCKLRSAEQAQEAVGKDAAFEEGVEVVFDELRQVGPGGHLCLGDEGSCVLLHHVVQRGLFREVRPVVDRGAIRHTLGLPADSLHARLPKW